MAQIINLNKARSRRVELQRYEQSAKLYEYQINSKKGNELDPFLIKFKEEYEKYPNHGMVILKGLKLVNRLAHSNEHRKYSHIIEKLHNELLIKRSKYVNGLI